MVMLVALLLAMAGTFDRRDDLWACIRRNKNNKTMKEIIAEFKPSGEVEIETKGFVGPACEAATKAVEELLGVNTSSKKKPEYYQKKQQTKQTT